jgi:hypothetical protein
LTDEKKMEKMIFSILSVNSMQIVTTLIVVVLIGFQYALYDELGIAGEKSYYFYYVVLSVVISISEVPLDMIVLNIIQCWSPLKMANKIREFKLHFKKRKRFWAVNDLAHLLNPETRNLNLIEKLGFSYQFYFILSTNCISVILFMIGLQLISQNNYNPLNDLWLYLVAGLLLMYFILLRVVINKLFRAIDLRNPDHDLVVHEEDLERVMRDRVKIAKNETTIISALVECKKYIDANYKDYGNSSDQLFRQLKERSNNSKFKIKSILIPYLLF